MIKLKKDVWVIKNIDEVCESIFAGGDVPKNSFSKTKTDKLTVPIFSNGEKDKGLFGYTDIEIVIKPSLTISARGTIGYSEIREGRYYPAVRLIVLIPNIRIIDLFFLKIAISNIDFASSGTSIPQLTVPMVKKYAIPLPPLDEQQRIVELFQSIEQSIVQAGKQEKNLHWLLHGLINDYTNPKSKYRKSTLQKIRFGNVAQNISERIEPKDAIGQIFVGLEHLDPRDIAIRRFGKPDDLIGTKLKVYEGDIIFSKRNAYLRKAAVANFTGICSAHAMVIRAIPEKIYKDFLPYFIHSDSFMARAKEISEGSISPTIKWKNLENQEFLIPSIEEQETISDLFIQIDQTCNLIREQKETLKKLKQKLLNEILG